MLLQLLQKRSHIHQLKKESCTRACEKPVWCNGSTKIWLPNGACLTLFAIPQSAVQLPMGLLWRPSVIWQYSEVRLGGSTKSSHSSFVQDKLLRTLALGCITQCVVAFLVRYSKSTPADKVAKWLARCLKPVLSNLRKGNLQFSEQQVRLLHNMLLSSKKRMGTHMAEPSRG